MNSQRKTDADLPHLDEPQNDRGPEPQAGKPRLKRLAIVATVGLLAAAAIAGWWLLRGTQSGQAGRPVPAPAAGNVVPAPSAERGGPIPQQTRGLVITLSQDKLEAAQIKTEPAAPQPISLGPGSSLRTAGTVASNQYKETPVFPIAGGVVRQVNAQLGDRVRRGQPLLTISSIELANAQAEYLKMLAELEEHEKAHHRTAELAEIGAASREDLEQHTARVDSMRAALASKRQQLIQLGITPDQVQALKSPDQVNSVLTVTAPVSGTVISRTVNSAELVATGKELFRVADLSTVWVLGQIYEKDLAAAREGTLASITTQANPGKTFNGRVSYVDPRIDPQTRTAQVRIEVPNPAHFLKIGMFVDIGLGENASAALASQNAVVVPAGAIQTIGNIQVVFVATDQPGVFIQRQVTARPENSGLVTVYSGVAPGERIVTRGSFLLRAESLKLKPDQVGS